MDEKTLDSLVERRLSTRGIASELGIGQTTVRYWLKKYGLKTSPSLNRRSWTDNDLIEACIKNNTISGVLRDLGLSTRNAGNYDTFKKYTKTLNIDTSHFVGRGSGIGGTKPMPLNQVLVRNSNYSRKSLKARLLKNGLLKNECYECALGNTWNKNPLTLVIDHINGVSNDNRLKNLRMLCPNCNSQQTTFAARNKSR